MAFRRLMREAKNLSEENLEWVNAEPNDRNLFFWNVSIFGPNDSPYEGGLFNLTLNFSENYPFTPPTVKFITKIYHPSIKTDTGEVCADLVTGDWKPTLNVKSILIKIRELLLAPSSDGSVEPDIANLIQNDYEQFVALAKHTTKQFAQ